MGARGFFFLLMLNTAAGLVRAAGPCPPGSGPKECSERSRVIESGERFDRGLSGAVDRGLASSSAPCSAGSCAASVAGARVAETEAARVADLAEAERAAALGRRDALIGEGIQVAGRGLERTRSTAATSPTSADIRRYLTAASLKNPLSSSQIGRLADEIRHAELRDITRALAANREAAERFSAEQDRYGAIAGAARRRTLELEARELKVGAADGSARVLASVAGERVPRISGAPSAASSPAAASPPVFPPASDSTAPGLAPLRPAAADRLEPELASQPTPSPGPKNGTPARASPPAKGAADGSSRTGELLADLEKLKSGLAAAAPEGASPRSEQLLRMALRLGRRELAASRIAVPAASSVSRSDDFPPPSPQENLFRRVSRKLREREPQLQAGSGG